MHTQREVLIVGGGIIGLTAAIAMSKRGFKVSLADASSLTSTPEESSQLNARAYAINGASQELLERLDVWQQLKASRLSPYQKMHVWDASNHKAIDFDSRTIAENRLGYIIEEVILKEALIQVVSQNPLITLFPQHRIIKIEPQKNNILVHANTKQVWTTDLLVIADGANSPCRKILNIPVVSWPYHQEALVGLIQTEKPHEQTAYQVFTPQGTLAFLPLADKYCCSIVWSTNPAHAKQLESLDSKQFNQELGRAFEYQLGKVQLQSKLTRFPLALRHTKQYSGLHWLLLGDAAHTIHPLAGLGLNMGFADLASWLDCLNASNNQFSNKAFSAYQRERKHAAWQVIAIMEGIKMLFLNPLFPIVQLRGFGIKIFNHLTPLKKRIIEYASGIK